MPASSLAQISPLFWSRICQPALDVRAVEHAGVGDQHHLHVVEAVACAFTVRTRCDDLVEVLVRRRLAVAGEGDVVEPPQVRRDVRGTSSVS